MFDCGIHPGHEGLASLPLFDHVEMASVNLALITHFHLDHCAAVPYLTSQSGFGGRLFMTHPTKAIYRTLLSDFLRVSQNADSQLYTEVDLENSMEKIEVIDFNQTLDIDGIKARRTIRTSASVRRRAACSGPGLSSGTRPGGGDVHGRHRRPADAVHRRLQPHPGPTPARRRSPLPPTQHRSVRPSAALLSHLFGAVVVESTYGVSNHLPRQQRELNFLKKVRGILDRGGNVLLPVVALGRAQEMLLMLEEHWDNNPELQHVPIYQASGLAMKALTVYQTYIEMMNEEIKKAFQVVQLPDGFSL